MSGKVCVTAISTTEIGHQEIEDRHIECSTYWGVEDGEEALDAYYEALRMAWKYKADHWHLRRFETHQYKTEYSGYWEDGEQNETEVSRKIERDGWDRFWDGVMDFFKPQAKPIPLAPLVVEESEYERRFRRMESHFKQ